MYTQFTWFEKITNMLNKIPNEQDRAIFALAIIDYGTQGIEPVLQYPLDMAFEAIREDIANSVKARQKNTGGRPKKQEVIEDKNTEETGGLEVHETDNNPLLYKPKPKPNTNPKEKRTSNPKSKKEVEEWALTDLPELDIEAFWDFYESKGWKVGKTPMKDWHAAARNAVRKGWAVKKAGDDDEYRTAF